MKINQVDAQGGLRRGGEGANGLKKTLNILAMVLIYWAIVDSVLTT